MLEFFAQGDKERELALDISPMCNREGTNRPVMQFNFIDFVVAPIYFRFIEIFPPLEECGTNMLNNQQAWLAMRTDEIMNQGDKSGKPGELEALQERMAALEERFQALYGIVDETIMTTHEQH